MPIKDNTAINTKAPIANDPTITPDKPIAPIETIK
jgi:hypothetical protein